MNTSTALNDRKTATRSLTILATGGIFAILVVVVAAMTVIDIV